MEKAAANQGEAGAGMGMGMGFMMPAMFADAFRQKGQTAPPENFCPDCKRPVAPDAKFCPHCGHQQLVFDQCSNCGKNLPPNARFCPRCGRKVLEKPEEKVCPTVRKGTCLTPPSATSVAKGSSPDRQWVSWSDRNAPSAAGLLNWRKPIMSFNVRTVM